MIAFTSRLALRDLIADVERHHGQRLIVYQTVKDWPGDLGPSREDISRKTGLRLSSVCGRVSELIKEGVICKAHMKEQEVVPGRPVPVETLSAVIYRESERSDKIEQLNLL